MYFVKYLCKTSQSRISMNIKIKTILIIGLVVSSITSNAQNIWKGFEHLFVPAKNYVIYKTTAAINIDGQANESDWEQASWSEYFEDIEGEGKPKPLYQTRVKMLWDETNIYIFAELEEPHVWAYYEKNDMIVFHENDFEVFIDPNRDTHNYYEFEVNAQNTLFDLFLDKPYRNGAKANIPWNAKGFQSAIHINGTLNNPTDKDESWTVEMKIPFSSLTINGSYLQPKNKDVWKINFSRVQWQTEVVDGKYVRKINPETNKRYPEFNWVWSPQGVINMHYPERWSMAQFSANHVGQNNETFQLPMDEKFANYLWLIYYKQQKYISEHGIYSKTLSGLDIPKTGLDNGISYRLNLKTDEQKYTATLETENDLVISINQLGLFQVAHK